MSEALCKIEIFKIWLLILVELAKVVSKPPFIYGLSQPISQFDGGLTLFGLGFFCNVFWLWLASVQSKIIVAQICLQILKALEKLSKKHPWARLVITSKLGKITLLSKQSKKEWEKMTHFFHFDWTVWPQKSLHPKSVYRFWKPLKNCIRNSHWQV